jgi:hypothetical protein
MKNMRISARALALVMALIMLSSVFAALPVSAINIDDQPLPDFLWELDFNKMSDAFDNMGSTDYTLEGKNINILEAHGKKALGVVNGSCQYFINDVNNLLNKYDTFSMEADMYFESFPTGSSGNDTAESYPMSFVTWMTQNEGDSKTSYRSIRVTHDGYLSTTNDPANRPDLVSDVQLPLKEWLPSSSRLPLIMSASFST